MPRSEYIPVVPDITDPSMREVDKDVKKVQEQKKRESAKTSPTSPTKPTQPTQPTQPGEPGEPDDASWGRKIVIGVLVVIIIVLVILLIYQIYKFYVTEEIPLVITSPLANAPVSSKRPASKKDDLDVIDSPSTSDIPDHVKNLDNDVLSSFIKKGGNSTGQRATVDAKAQNRDAHRNRHQDDLQDDVPPLDDMTSLSNIIDNTRGQGETPIDAPPTRQDDTDRMLREAARDSRHAPNLVAIEEESDDIVGGYMNANAGDDTDADSSASDDTAASDGGCQFELTKGKNKGSVCGRMCTNGVRCGRHAKKQA